MVIFDVLGFCVLAYLICAQVFNFFPWKPVEIEITDLNADVGNFQLTAKPTPTKTPEPVNTPKPSDVPAVPTTTEGEADPSVQTPFPADTPEPTPESTPEPTPEPTDLLKGKFAEKFVSGQVISNESEYRSENIAIELSSRVGYVCGKCSHTAENPGTCPFCGYTIGSRKSDTVTYTVADIYIRDLSCLKTAFAPRASDTKLVKDMCRDNNGILAVNTDYFLNIYTSDHGWVVRNGIEIKRNKNIKSDLCVLYLDGTMQTIDYKKESVDYGAILARGPQQIWYFGPELLDKTGAAKTKFNSTLGKANPRTVIGYYEPGHYCFFVVDGRHGERGLTFDELSLLCADMGLTAAYNMDGGASSGLYFNGKSYGQNGRDTGDIVYIAEP